MSRIRAFFFVIEFFITVAVVIVCFFFFKKHQRETRRVWGRIQKFFIGYKPNIIGNPDPKATLLIINHQSMLDIVSLEYLYPGDTAWCAKKELFDIALFGQALKLSNMISIDRSDKRAIVKLIKDAKDRLKSNRVIAIFPEGTRGDGKSLLQFQLGAKILAEKLDLKVQPIVMSNAKDIFDLKHFKINSGKLNISYMPLIDPKSDTNWYENLFSSMQQELNRLKTIE